MYHARVLAASHSIYGRVVTESALLYTDCPKNSLSPLLQGQPLPRGDVWARALGMRGNAPNSRAPAVSVSFVQTCNLNNDIYIMSCYGLTLLYRG